MKLVRIYTQTFTATKVGTPSYQWYFKWNKLYKQDPKNKFMISCIDINSCENDVEETPFSFYLSSPAMTSFCANSSALAVNTDQLIDYPDYMNNDWFLGGLGGSVNTVSTQRGDHWGFAPSTLLVDDLPLEPFLIYWRDPTTSYAVRGATGTFTGVRFAFRIDEVSMD